jgi:hypothetical protein
MVLMEDSAVKVGWNLEQLEERIQVNNVNQEAIMKIRMLTMTESLKLTSLSI